MPSSSLTFLLTSSAFFGGLAIGAAATWFFAKQRLSDEADDEDEDDWEDDDEDDDEEDDDEEVAFPNETLKMILVVRTDLKMGRGKAAAQCCHATLAAYRSAKRRKSPHLRPWLASGQQKVTVKVDSEDDLLMTLAMAESLGIVSAVIRDAGRTQIAPGSKTVVAVGPAPESLIDRVTGHLKLY